MKKFLSLFFVAIIAVACCSAVWHQTVHQPLTLVSPIRIELPKGSGTATLAEQLSAAGLIKYPLMVRVAARVYGYDRRLKAGEYLIQPGNSLLDIFNKISAGKVIMHKLTIPEGLTTAQIMTLIESTPFLSGDITLKVEEGELMPETYTFSKGTTRDTAIRKAQNAMSKAAQEIFAQKAEEAPLKSPTELIILASIIEKETGVSSEREIVASVFMNRLNAGMPLQTDPTVIYALTKGQGNLERALTRKDLEIDSPYNTYKYKGLPPKPICNPGIKALKAAANPARTPYFYFVADGKGGHNFSKTLMEHNRFVQLWKKVRS